jgi:hypothetical protein
MAYAYFISGMGPQCVVSHQLLGNLQRQGRLKPSAFVNFRKFGFFEFIVSDSL